MWIDLDECKSFGTKAGMLFKTKDDAWVLQRDGNEARGEEVKAVDAFKLLMQSNKLDDAEKHFPDDFKKGKL